MGPDLVVDARSVNPPDLVAAAEVDGLDGEQQQQLLAVLRDFREMFSNHPGKVKLPDYVVDTGNHPPAVAKPYSIPLPYLYKVKEELKTMEEMEVMEPSDSEWSSPAFTIPKKTGDIRLVNDYRELNSLTIQNIYSLPNIEQSNSDSGIIPLHHHNGSDLAVLPDTCSSQVKTQNSVHNPPRKVSVPAFTLWDKECAIILPEANGSPLTASVKCIYIHR